MGADSLIESERTSVDEKTEEVDSHKHGKCNRYEGLRAANWLVYNSISQAVGKALPHVQARGALIGQTQNGNMRRAIGGENFKEFAESPIASVDQLAIAIFHVSDISLFVPASLKS